jgi:hypothetical protein
LSLGVGSPVGENGIADAPLQAAPQLAKALCNQTAQDDQGPVNSPLRVIT